MALDMKAFTKLKWFYQILIVAGVCGLLLAGVWYEFLAPMQDQIVAKLKSVDDLQQQVAKSLQQKKMFEQMKADSIELVKKLDDLKKVLPLDKETDQIIKSIYTEASTSGVQILKLGVRPVIEHEVYTEWPWDMEGVGTYNGIAAFFDKIRQLPRIVNISGVRISSRNSDGDKAFTESISASYTATTFIYHEEQIATTAPPAKPVK